MCYKCETDKRHGVQMTLQAIDIEKGRKHTNLPDVWKKLEASNFHDDLMLRAYAHMLWSQRKAMETDTPTIAHNARVFLSAMGKGFAERFKREDFTPLSNDPFYTLKEKALDAIVELDAFFGDRVSSVIWNSFAHLATREEPEVKKSILKEAATG